MVYTVTQYFHLYLLLPFPRRHLTTFSILFLLPYSVPGLLEYEAIPGISNSRPIGSKRCGSHDSMITTETVTKELTSVLGVLEKNYVDPHTVGQIMKQVWGGGGKLVWGGGGKLVWGLDYYKYLSYYNTPLLHSMNV